MWDWIHSVLYIACLSPDNSIPFRSCLEIRSDRNLRLHFAYNLANREGLAKSFWFCCQRIPRNLNVDINVCSCRTFSESYVFSAGLQSRATAFEMTGDNISCSKRYAMSSTDDNHILICFETNSMSCLRVQIVFATRQCILRSTLHFVNMLLWWLITNISIELILYNAYPCRCRTKTESS